MKKIKIVGIVWLVWLVGGVGHAVKYREDELAAYRKAPVCEKTTPSDSREECRDRSNLPIVGFTWSSKSNPEVIVKVNGNKRRAYLKDSGFWRKIKDSDNSEIMSEVWHSRITTLALKDEIRKTSEHPENAPNALLTALLTAVQIIGISIVLSFHVIAFYLIRSTTIAMMSMK